MSRQGKISKMILAYLKKNPEAGDTLEGITKWWIKLEKIELSVNEVAEILESLMQKGLIKMCKNKGGATFYRIDNKI